MSKKGNLGRGLSALLGDAPKPDTTPADSSDRQQGHKHMPVALLKPGKYQPRRTFKPDDLDDLVDSISRKGVLQPLLVRPHPDEPNHYEIIAGERRWRASQKAGLRDVPVIIKTFDDKETLEVALVENLQRQDLTPLEEADGYKRLMDEFSHTQEELAKAVGKSRSHVANTMRLLQSPEKVKILIEEGELSAGHARALLTAKDPVALAKKIVEQGLNVRQTEKLVQKTLAEKQPAKKAVQPIEKDEDTVALEKDLSSVLGVKVNIKLQGTGGILSLQYDNLEQLDDILQRLGSAKNNAIDADDAAPIFDENNFPDPENPMPENAAVGAYEIPEDFGSIEDDELNALIAEKNKQGIISS
jgi:ParB family chromosome partitioning protein